MSIGNELRDYATAVEGGYADDLTMADARRLREIATIFDQIAKVADAPANQVVTQCENIVRRIDALDQPPPGGWWSAEK